MGFFEQFLTWKKLTTILSAGAILGLSLPSSVLAQIEVDAELSLLLDISPSIDASEYALQVEGYVDAFRNLDFSESNVAVNAIVWSGPSLQFVEVDWTLITDNATADAFADSLEIALSSREPNNGTAPGSAINFAVPLFGTETGFADNGFLSDTQIIDISGDGVENQGIDTATARDFALAAGIDVINGLIVAEDPDQPIAELRAFYENEVIGGTNSNGDPAFVLEATSFEDFGDTITEKIAAELFITPIPTVPEPNSLVGLGFLGLGFILTKKRSFKWKGKPLNDK